MASAFALLLEELSTPTSSRPCLPILLTLCFLLLHAAPPPPNATCYNLCCNPPTTYNGDLSLPCCLLAARVACIPSAATCWHTGRACGAVTDAFSSARPLFAGNPVYSHLSPTTAHLYLLYRNTTNFNDARARCQALNSGAGFDLATFGTRVS